MAFFATDDELNIQDEEIAGFYKKPPKSPKIWGYLFWISVLLCLFIFLMSITVSHGQVITYYQQQDTSTSTYSGVAGGNIGQSNIFLSAPVGTTTVYSIRLHFRYPNAAPANQVHRVCFFAQGYNEYSQVIIDPANPAGCLSRTILGGDLGQTKDYQFTGTVVLPQGYDYVFYNHGVSTSTLPSAWANSLMGVGDSDPNIWYGSPNDNAYGNNTVVGSAAINSADNGVLYKNSPEYPGINYNGVADMFFIINASVPTGGTNPVPVSCEGGGVFDTLLCNLYVSLFIPSSDALNQFSSLWDSIKYKPPFGYYTAVSTALSGVAIGTTTLEFAGVSSLGGFFNPLRIALNYALWFLLAIWIFHRLRNFNF